MIEINMPLNREKVKGLLADAKYQTIEITDVKEAGIKLNVEVTGDVEAGAKEIKDQLKAELGGGFFFSVNVK
ncbi:hypothetical protein R2F61_03380 [Mollicutes bacterium LVI A0078]|nr:hypothetical protein RZE84_03410 [Mollicutes bacterium LVI A0075]WOO91606.1 hypothetical protein R2F61_03380 [Mollicutes bacterium LVI A0078]